MRRFAVDSSHPLTLSVDWFCIVFIFASIFYLSGCNCNQLKNRKLFISFMIISYYRTPFHHFPLKQTLLVIFTSFSFVRFLSRFFFFFIRKTIAWFLGFIVSRIGMENNNISSIIIITLALQFMIDKKCLFPEEKFQKRTFSFSSSWRFDFRLICYFSIILFHF